MAVDFGDEVRNVVSGVTGVVRTTFTKVNIQYVDVLCGDRMYYESPITNWEVVVKGIDY